MVVGLRRKPKPSGRISSVPSPYIRPLSFTRSLRMRKIKLLLFQAADFGDVVRPRPCRSARASHMRCNSAMWTLRSCTSSFAIAAPTRRTRSAALSSSSASERGSSRSSSARSSRSIMTSPLPSEGRMRRCIGTRAIVPRVAVRLISHELFAPGEKRAGRTDGAEWGGTSKKDGSRRAGSNDLP